MPDLNNLYNYRKVKTKRKQKEQLFSLFEWTYFIYVILPIGLLSVYGCISQVKSEPLRNSILNHPKIKSYSLVDSFFNHSSVSRIRKDGPFIFKTCDLCVNRSVNAAVNT